MVANTKSGTKTKIGNLPDWLLKLDADAAAAYVGPARGRFPRAVAQGVTIRDRLPVLLPRSFKPSN